MSPAPHGAALQVAWQVPRQVPCSGCFVTLYRYDMASHHHHAVSRAVSENPGWSLLRLSAAGRLGLAALVIAALWLVTLTVIT